MKVKKIFAGAVLLAFLLIALLGLCIYIGHLEKSESLMEISLYFFNPSENTIAEEKRSIPKTADRSLIITSVETAYREGPKTPNLVRAVPDSVVMNVEGISREAENTVNVNLSESFYSLSESARLVCIGSVVYTFSSLDFIDNVRLSVNGESIADRYNMYGKNTASLNRENVLNNPMINPEKINRQNVVLYFPRAKGIGLKAEERSIEVKQSQTLEYQIVEQLILGPADAELKAAVPQDTKIKDIKTEEGICYVNLSGDFVSKLSGNPNDEKLIIYSIVNSLTELNSVNKVQFLIEGEKVSGFKGHYDFSKTFERDETLISK